jgi:branched-chain amino acid transport system ATP-binding protein
VGTINIPAVGASVAQRETLEARDVAVRFGGVVALDGVNIALRRGEVFGLIGPNGAGKSTTVNVLTGFQQPSTGDVLVDGVSILGLSAHRIARLGVARTFQAARLFSSLTVLENVMVAATNAAGKTDNDYLRARDILRWVGCADKANQLSLALSYGDQRRVAIARSLALSPKYVLLDEPAAGMNERECDQLVSLISEMPDRWGCGVLLIEHNMSVVMRTCGRILVLDGGKPIAEGTPAAIQANVDVRRAYLGDKETTVRSRA